MASKWRSQQRRQRWEHSSPLLPPRLLHTLQQQTQLGAFGHHLLAWARLSSTFAQVSEAKHVAQSLLAFINPPTADSVDPASPLSAEALNVYVEVLFQQNSKPVHRTFLTALSQLPLGFEDSIINAFEQCCRDYGRKGAKESRFALIAVAMSLVNLPKAGLLKGVMKQCSRIIGLSLSYDLQYVLRQAQKGENPTPAVMEECQDAMATLYYLLQHFPEMFATSLFATSEVSDPSKEDQASQFYSGFFSEEISKTGVFGAVVNTVLDVLQSSLMSRDCVVAAGVCLCTAALLQSSQLDLALIFANHMFASQNLQLAIITEHGIAHEPSAPGLLEETIASERRSSLHSEMDNMTDFGKLCVMRGLLTGIPRAVLNIILVSGAFEDKSFNRHDDVETAIRDLSFEMPKRKSCQVWTLLYDGILPTICSCCEASVDSHFKFHSITALQICLQQIKASMMAHLTESAVKGIESICSLYELSLRPYEVFPEAITKRVLKLIWNNWEDPLAQTVKQIQAVFDLLADVQALIPQKKSLLFSSNTLEVSSEKTTEEITKVFLGQIAADLLSVGGHRKGRYAPLASLALRLGARTLLDMKPDLLFQTVYALSDDDVCCSASSFLRTFLERLREEYWNSEGVMEGYSKFRRLWIPAILAGLFFGNPRLRCNMNTYALPVALQIDGDSLLPMLAFLLDGYLSEASFNWDEIKGSVGMPDEITMNQRVSALVSVLKVARALFLIDGEIAAYVGQGQTDLRNCQDDCDPTMDAAVHIKGQVIHIPIFLLELALTHMEDGLRIDAAELLGLNPKGASMPSRLELHLLKYAIPLNVRCSSTAFRMKWTNMLKKFFTRVRTAVERQIKIEGVNTRMSDAQSRASVMDTVKTFEKDKLNELAIRSGDANRSSTVTVEEMQEFMQWLSQLLVCSLYPSAPYERKNMAMELFNALLEVWSLSEFSRSLLHHAFTPYHTSLLSAESILVLVCAVVDSWDRLRESAFRILVRYPTPLPGIDTDYTVQGLVKWAKGLVSSPRVRESDAGARALRLVFRKYVCELAWMVQVHASAGDVIVQTRHLVEEKDRVLAGEAVCLYINSLNDWLEAGIQEGERDLLAACKNSLVHGVLLTLRYTMDEIDWTSEAVHAGAQRLQLAFKTLIGLLLRVTSLTLGIVSANALNIHEHMSRHSKLQEGQSIFDDVELSTFEDEEEMGDQLDCKLEMLAPAEQMMMVGCWLSMKEVSLLLGTITRRVPLSGCAVAAESQCELVSTSNTQNAVGSEENHQVFYLLDAEQLEMIGEHFLNVLFSMKHNGAVDKTRAGFSALCNRLLHVNDSRLGKLPERWLQQLMQRTCSKGQTVDDLLRRSAGLPAAFLALFLAEPDGAPRKLLPMAMKWLLSHIKSFLLDSMAIVDSDDQSLKYTDEEITNSETERKANTSGGSVNVVELSKAIKAREEGVVPTVHAFNVLKLAFHDTNLSTDTSGFCAEGLMLAIQAFSSRHWEVRNSAILAFTALVHRTVGFLNVHKRETARRTITGFEFFNRYPALHSFLLQELQSATLHLEHASSGRATTFATISNALHPSLAPILIVLSRLKPSAINTGVEDWLSPSFFMPLVMRCATQCNLKVRLLASQALAPLVSSESLSKVLIELACSLPPTDEIGSFEGESHTNNALAANKRPHIFRYNAIHGTLLQLCVLLKHNTPTISDSQEQEKIAAKVFQVIDRCLWLGSTRLCSCYVVISEFLHLLQVLLEVSESSKKAVISSYTSVKRIRSTLLDLCAECLGDRFVLAGRLWDANIVGLLERAANLFFSTVFNALLLEDVTESGKESRLKPFEGNPLLGTVGVACESIVPVTESKDVCTDPLDEILFKHFKSLMGRLRNALISDIYEVRLVTLKVLKHCDPDSIVKWISKGPSHPYNSRFGLDSKQLPLLLTDCLMAESQGKCLTYILHLLFTWKVITVNNQGAFSGVGATCLENFSPVQGTESDEGLTAPTQICQVATYFSTIQLWNKLIEIYKSAKVAKMKEITICCLGGCLSQLIADIREFLSQSLLSCNSTSLEENLKPCHGQPHTLSSHASRVIGLVDSPSSDLLKDPDVSQSSGECVACCIEDGKGDKWKAFSKAVDEWLLLIAKHSSPSEPVTFRRAVAEAIAASEILKDVSWVVDYLPGYFHTKLSKFSEKDCRAKFEWYGRSILSVWSICIKLLEDEDLTLRQTLAKSILSIVGSRRPTENSDAVLVQVEMIIVMSFNYLTECLAHWNVYFDFLILWVFGPESSFLPKTADFDLVRRLFDKEIDNHHEEELLIVQLCCINLQNIVVLVGRQMDSFSNGFGSKSETYQPSTPFLAASSPEEGYLKSDLGFGEESQDYLMLEKAKTNFFTLVHCWRLKFLEKAIMCARWCNIAQSSIQWLGGITNHQDAFGILCRNLLGIYSLIGPCSSVGNTFTGVLEEHSISRFISGIYELADLLRSIPVNPIIQNLLGACLVGYECYFGVDLGSASYKGDAANHTISRFEPFFLIK